MQTYTCTTPHTCTNGHVCMYVCTCTYTHTCVQYMYMHTDLPQAMAFFLWSARVPITWYEVHLCTCAGEALQVCCTRTQFTTGNAIILYKEDLYLGVANDGNAWLLCSPLPPPLLPFQFLSPSMPSPSSSSLILCCYPLPSLSFPLPSPPLPSSPSSTLRRLTGSDVTGLRRWTRLPSSQARLLSHSWPSVTKTCSWSVRRSLSSSTWPPPSSLTHHSSKQPLLLYWMISAVNSLCIM